MPTTRKAMARRLIFMNSPKFIPNMVRLLDHSHYYFRWFDSGDIQSEQMGKNILDVIRHLCLGVLVTVFAITVNILACMRVVQ